MYEDQAIVRYTAKIFRDEVGVRFDFGNEKDSIYSVDLHIEERCTGFLFDDKTLSWQGVSSGDKIIQEMIDE